MKIKSWLKHVRIDTGLFYVDNKLSSEYNQEDINKDIKYVNIQSNGLVCIYTKNKEKK